MKKKINVTFDTKMLYKLECASDYYFIHRNAVINFALAEYFEKHQEIFKRISY